MEGLAQGRRGQSKPVSLFQEAKTAAVPPGCQGPDPMSPTLVPKPFPCKSQVNLRDTQALQKAGVREDGAGTKGDRGNPWGSYWSLRARLGFHFANRDEKT